MGDRPGAIEEYRNVVASKPAYVAARVALADLLAKAGGSDAAIKELLAASQADPQNAGIPEQIGDLESARGRTAEAKAAYTSAAALSVNRATRKRLTAKLR